MSQTLSKIWIAIILLVLVAGGIFAWQYFGTSEKAPGDETATSAKEKFCRKDSDCACGRNRNTGDCFYGNKDYVTRKNPCPDFCSGFTGEAVIKCIDHECRQFFKPLEAAEKLDTSNWQTYRNEKYGFEFSYPEGWAAIESVSPGYPYLVFVSLGRQETIQEGGLFWVVIRDQTEDTYLSSLAEGEFYIISRTDSSLGDKKATTYIYGRTTGSPGIQWKAIVAQKNGLLLEVSKGATLGSDDIFNQILSTFRFKDECVISGCSGEICSDEGVLTTCLYLPHYECYKEAVCERQPDGQCGWTTTETLKQCLEDKRATFRFVE